MTSFAMVEGVTVEEMTAAMTPSPAAKPEAEDESEQVIPKRPRRKPDAEED